MGSLGPSWAHVGPCWYHLGVNLGSSWAILGPSWGHPGAILGHLGPSWGLLGAILGPSWAILGHLGAILGPTWAIMARTAPRWPRWSQEGWGQPVGEVFFSEANLWGKFFSSFFGSPGSQKTLFFLMKNKVFQGNRITKLTSNFNPILLPIWLHFGSQNRPKADKKRIQETSIFFPNF